MRIMLSNDDAVAGIQFQLRFSSSISFGELSEASRTSGWIVAGHKLNDSTMNVVIISSSREYVTQGSGPVAAIKFSGRGLVEYRDVVLGSPEAKGLAVTAEGTWLRDEATHSIALDQNYPNPFNPSTQLHYTLLDPGHVRLAIFDITGREVSVLVDADQSPGTFNINWTAQSDGIQLASGTYFARLSMGGEVQLKKMTLMR